MIKQLLFSVSVVLCCATSIFCQYNYGLEVIDHDAKIEGKLNLNASGQSIFIGLNSGIEDDGTNNENTFLGYQSGRENIDGYHNVFLGHFSGHRNISGYNNIFIGDKSGFENLS